jgi:hypothetical protein
VKGLCEPRTAFSSEGSLRATPADRRDLRYNGHIRKTCESLGEGAITSYSNVFGFTMIFLQKFMLIM